MAVTFHPVAAETYEASVGHWSRLLAPLLLDFAAPEEAERILDVGCGTGALTAALAHRFKLARINGLDLTASFIEYAISNSPDPSRIDFEIGDATALPYESASFDFTASNLLLHFVPNSHQAIREMARVTKLGGIVCATVPNLRGGFPHLRLVFDTAAALDNGAAEYRQQLFSAPGVRPNHLASLWKNAGIEQVTAAALTFDVEVPSFTALWEPIEQSGNFGAYLRGLPDNRRSAIREKVRSAYLLGDKDGPRHFMATAWAVKGVIDREIT